MYDYLCVLICFTFVFPLTLVSLPIEHSLHIVSRLGKTDGQGLSHHENYNQFKKVQ